MIFKTEGFVHTDRREDFYREIFFDLESDAEMLRFEFFSAGKEIFFHVKDPSGILRVQHQSKSDPSSVVLHSRDEKSGAGTFPGKILKGRWNISVFTYAPRFNRMWGMIPFEVKVYGPDEITCPGPVKGKEVKTKWWADAAKSSAKALVLKDFEPDRPLPAEEERWRCGDLHVHTCLSDGSAEASELLEEGLSKKLDFFFITEHNILTTGFPEKEGIEVFPSYEVTTVAGHFNALGLRYAPQWLLPKGPAPSWKDLEKLMADFRAEGVLISINHPFFEPWQWQYNDLPLSMVDSIEVITDPYDRRTDSVNEKAFALIDLLWSGGCRITGVGGSDTHTRFSDSQLGQPVTKLFSLKGSLASHLDAVKKNRAQVLPEADVLFSYFADGKEILPGTMMESFDDVKLECHLEIPSSGSPLLLELVGNGEVAAVRNVSPGEKAVIDFRGSRNTSWIRCGLRHPEGNLAGYINPLYRSIAKSPVIKTWQDALEKLG